VIARTPLVTVLFRPIAHYESSKEYR